MKVKWTDILGECHGNCGARQYARSIPGDTEWACVCTKPTLSKRVKAKKANLPSVQRFKENMVVCKAILHDPVRRSEWQARYDAARREAVKHGKKIQCRLCDYVRHEVSLALNRGEAVG